MQRKIEALWAIGTYRHHLVDEQPEYLKPVVDEQVDRLIEANRLVEYWCHHLRQWFGPEIGQLAILTALDKVTDIEYMPTGTDQYYQRWRRTRSKNGFCVNERVLEKFWEFQDICPRGFSIETITQGVTRICDGEENLEVTLEYAKKLIDDYQLLLDSLPNPA